MAPNRSSSRPPHCPHRDCNSHSDPRPWRFKKKGFYHRDQVPRRVQRYRCHHCGRSFSSQSFETTYWLRRSDLLVPLFDRLVAGSGLRQIARGLGVSHATVQRQTERLGRHCLLFHERLRRRLAPPDEPLVLDGFRTFEHSQFWPFDLNLVIGTSHFIYGFSDAELRRSGTMRPAQKAKRAELEACFGRPDPQATRRSVESLLRRVIPPGSEVRLHSDEHTAYPQAIRRLRDRTIHHEATSSRRARTTSNPLFPVNLADLLLRHCSANHKRETIAFSKRRQGALYRAAIFLVWRNCVKSRSENRRDGPPAKRLGLIRQALPFAGILAARIFPERVGISGWLARCYFGRIPTRAIERCRMHAARYAR